MPRPDANEVLAKPFTEAVKIIAKTTQMLEVDFLKLASPEYMQEVVKRTNSDENYLKLSKGENEIYTLVLEAEPEKGVAGPSALCSRVEDGKIVEIYSSEREATFRISAPYGIWVDILTGKLDANKALMTRKLKVKGNFMKLLKYSQALLRWTEILRTIPTEFEGQYAEFNIKGA
jgi:putative sterol carrier protein